jgi:hypothetical protein
VQVGNLVRVKRSDSDIQGRDSGVVLKFDVYHPDAGYSTETAIAEVLWSRGPEWIASSRIEAINERRILKG